MVARPLRVRATMAGLKMDGDRAGEFYILGKVWFLYTRGGPLLSLFRFVRGFGLGVSIFRVTACSSPVFFFLLEARTFFFFLKILLLR